MVDCQCTGKLFRYINTHQGQLSLSSFLGRYRVSACLAVQVKLGCIHLSGGR